MIKIPFTQCTKKKKKDDSYIFSKNFYELGAKLTYLMKNKLIKRKLKWYFTIL